MINHPAKSANILTNGKELILVRRTCVSGQKFFRQMRRPLIYGLR